MNPQPVQDWGLVSLIIFVLLAFFLLRTIMKAKLSLDARPRIPSPSALPAGDCKVVQSKPPAKLIAAIKELRQITGWNLRDSKLAIESEQVVIGVSLEAAEQVLAILERHGGEARIEEYVPAAQVEVSGRSAGASRCPYCHEEANPDGDQPVVACTACLARHHESCWDEHRQCAGCGHNERFSAVEQTEGREPRRDGPTKAG